MGPKFSLEPLTIIGCAPPEMTRIAARAGYDYISYRLIPMEVPGEASFYPHDRAMLRQTREALRETGIAVHDIELARILEDVPAEAYLPAMELGAELGARHLIASAWTQSRDDRNFIIERFAQICALAQPLGLTVSLEFPSFSRLVNLQETADIVRTANCSNGAILVDTLYLHFSCIHPEEISVLPSEWFRFIHLCDAPAHIPSTREGLIHIARDERLYPGEGCIDFAAIAAVLPEDVIYAVELPHQDRIQRYGYEGHARRCLQAARATLSATEQNFAKTRVRA